MLAGWKSDRMGGQTQGMVVSKGSRNLRLPISLSIVCVVIVVATAVTYGYLYVLSQHAKRDAITAKHGIAELDDQEFTQLKIEEKSDSASGSYAAAADAWVAYAKKTTSKSHRGQALQRAGLLYVTAGEYQEGQDSFLKAVSVTGLTYTEATEIGTAAARAGNKDVAIQYFQKALQLMPKDSPDPTAQKQLFNSEIEQLKQGST